jgi:GT2 family glycosyltransferase
MSRNATELALSVVIPTHNPRQDYLRRVLEALRGQTLPREQWELLVVDNGSRVPLRVGIRHTAEGIRQEKSLPSHIPTLPSATPHAVSARRGGLRLPPFTELDLSWHPKARIVREENLGLTFARLRGFAEARGELIVMVDDDNALAPDYLETAVRIAQAYPALGAFGGKCLPEFEVKPEEWLASVTSGLGLRDLGEAPQLFPEETGERSVSVEQCFSEAIGKPELLKNRTTVLPKNRVTRRVTEFPDCAPIGAGMVLRREAARVYAERLRRRSGLRVAGSKSDGVRQEAEGIRHTADGEEGASVGQCCGRAVGKPELPKSRITEPPNHRTASVITDRRGDSLASGGDNDICLTVIEEGWQVGYLPELKLTHLIPKGRMTLDYHKRMARDSMKSYILMLDQHGIRPWPAMPQLTLPLRVAGDWWRVKPWQGPQQSLRFWGHVGMYEGRALLAESGAR